MTTTTKANWRARLLTAAMTLILAASSAMAETGSAESPDFTVNTVPEPAAMLVAVAAFSLLVARRTRP